MGTFSGLVRTVGCRGFRSFSGPMEEDVDKLVNYAGDLLFGFESTGLPEFVWNSKTVGGKLLICTVQARQKHVSLNSFLSKGTIFSVVWFMDLVEDYSLWES